MIPHGERLQTPQQELQHLGADTEKRYMLQAEGAASREQAARGAVEAYARAQAADFIHESQVLPAHEAERIVLNLKPESHDKKIEELFGLMLEKGVKNTLDMVEKLGDAHLRDDFHRFLVQYLHAIGAIPGIKENDPLYRELAHTLFCITLPPQTDANTDFKKIGAAMEQFVTSLTALVGLKETISIELAVEHSTSSILCYVAVPKERTDGFEKLVHSFFAGAAVEAVPDDYNLFSPEAPALSGSTATLREAAWKPLKTYQDFEHDPFSAVVGALSRIKALGEGAALQVVIREPKERVTERNMNILENAQKGNGGVDELYKNATETVLGGLAKEALSFFKKDEEKKDDEKKIDTTGTELLKKKTTGRIVEATVRIMASAQTAVRADELRRTVEAAYGQYDYTGGNALSWTEAKRHGLTELAQAFSFRRIGSAPLELSVQEVASLVHLPTSTAQTPHELGTNDGASAPAPARASMQTEGVYLGTNAFRGQSQDVYLAKEDRVRHCYVIGQTGTGKTTILKNMAIQDIKNGNGICFIDPHGTDLEDIIANIPAERLDDVIYFDPAYTARPMGLNMLEYDPQFPEQKIFVINELLAIFNKLFDMKVAGGPAFEQYFRNAAGLVMEDPASGSTLLEIGRVLSDKAFRQMKLERCKNPIIKQFWENAEKTTGEASLANFVPYITNKFDVFISNDIMRPVIAQEKSVLNFREIMDQKKILLVNLSKGRLGDINSHLIGLVLVGKITMAALSRVDTLGKGTLNDFYLYIDEFQNVTTDSIATILSEARKYRLALTVAHQYIEQLEEKIKNAVFGNVGSMIVYRVSPENAAVFERQLTPTFTPDDLLKLQNFNAIVKMLVGGTPEKPFTLRIPPPPKGNSEIADKIKELSYLKYGRPREEVEATIMARYQR